MLDISKAFKRVRHVDLLHKLKSYGVSGQIFGLFSIIDGFEWFWMGSPLKNVQLMTVFLKTPFLVLHFSYYTLMAFLNGLPDVICSIAIYADDISLYPKSDQASDL